MDSKPSKAKTTLAARLGIGLLVLLCFGSAILHFIYFRYGNEDSFDEIIYAAAQRHDVDPLLIKAIIKRESRFQFRSVGSKGEIGLMQLMPGAVTDWQNRFKKPEQKRGDLFKPAVNIEIGTWYFANAFKQWKNSPNPAAYALAQYNAGRGNLLKWIDKHGKLKDYQKLVQFPTTREYIKTILGYYQEYLAEKGKNNG